LPAASWPRKTSRKGPTAVDLPDDAEYYLCGPLPFLKSVRSGLVAKGVPAKDIQYEMFGPDLWLADFQ
jgi:nitric oxide dioxygenase